MNKYFCRFILQNCFAQRNFGYVLETQICNQSQRCIRVCSEKHWRWNVQILSCKRKQHSYAELQTCVYTERYGLPDKSYTKCTLLINTQEKKRVLSQVLTKSQKRQFLFQYSSMYCTTWTPLEKSASELFYFREIYQATLQWQTLFVQRACSALSM